MPAYVSPSRRRDAGHRCRGSIVIAAPLSSAQIARLAGAYRDVTVLIDLRAEAAHDPPPPLAPIVTLADVFASVEQAADHRHARRGRERRHPALRKSLYHARQAQPLGVARPVRVKIASRASSLARLQTALVERALGAAHPQLEIECVTRTSAGDQDQTSPLWKLPDKGAFTADISQALVAGDADIVVHSFKDLPIEMPAGLYFAGALPRADARDVVLIKQSAVDAQPESLRILSSSPRRGGCWAR